MSNKKLKLWELDRISESDFKAKEKLPLILVLDDIRSLNNIGTFLKTKKGYIATNPEGFVAIDHANGGAVKLVDRLEFSTNNFNPNIIKGWENPG